MNEELARELYVAIMAQSKNLGSVEEDERKELFSIAAKICREMADAFYDGSGGDIVAYKVVNNG